MPSGSSVGPRTVSVSRGRGGLNCPQPLIWTSCRNWYLQCYLQMPLCIPPSRRVPSSTGPIQQGSCIFTGRSGLGKGQALFRGNLLPRPCPEASGPPTLVHVIQHSVADPGKV